MLKIIIADDEPHFRNYIQGVLPWEALGFLIVGAYKNGEEALQESEKVRPDIALLDINMPGMDGLLLTEKLKERFPEMVIVFVTGYSEFEYARKAMRLGVDEYLLKPFSKEELTEVMEKIKLKLQKQTETRQYKKMDRKIVKEELLKRWIHDSGRQAEEMFCADLERVGVSFAGSSYRTVVIEMDNIIRMRKKEDDIELWKFAIANISEEILGEEEIPAVLVEDYEDRIIAILNEQKDIHKEMRGVFEKIREKTKMHLGLAISVGIGTEEQNLKGLKQSYQNAMAAMEEKFILGGEQVFSAEETRGEKEGAYFYRLELNDCLLSALRKNKKEEIEKILKDTKEKITKYRIPADHAYMVVSGMMSICLSYVAEMNGRIDEIYGKGFAPYTQLYHLTSLEQSFEYLTEVFDKAMSAFQTTYSKRGAEILEQVEAYIKQNYRNLELSVEDVATGVYLDSSYLRRIVSRNAGCTITELITRERMKEAARLIATEAFTITEISERVGYKEPGYFSKCFKKYFGVSPKQYYSQHRGSEKTGH